MDGLGIREVHLPQLLPGVKREQERVRVHSVIGYQYDASGIGDADIHFPTMIYRVKDTLVASGNAIHWIHQSVSASEEILDVHMRGPQWSGG